MESSAQVDKVIGIGSHVAEERKSIPSRVKSNKGGMSFPLAILASGTRRSSKKGCVMASIAVRRAEGVYSSSLEIKSIASGGVRGRNTCCERVSSVSQSTQTLRLTRPYFREWMRFNLGELVLHVIRIHGFDLFSRRRA